MYLQEKGTAPIRLTWAFPEGPVRDEHGRQGSRALPPTSSPSTSDRVEPDRRPSTARACTCGITTPDQRIPDGAGHDSQSLMRESVFHADTTMTHFVRNADGDEMIFVHQGQGRLETDYGLLPMRPAITCHSEGNDVSCPCRPRARRRPLSDR